ncbi:MAG: signal peptidase I [Clostridia bacterium]|nr:signal peptidase I [Clostridia bacterium]NCC66580.1 signal peptidase I [Clostridia bacterium]
MEKRRRKKVISITVNFLLIISTVLCFAVIFQAATSSKVSVFGFRFFYVTTESMAPTIPAGSLTAVKKSGAYEAGDVITFTSRDSAIYGSANTHRIIGVQNEDGATEYITQGDANSFADALPVPEGDVIGKVVWHTGKMAIIGKLIALLGTRFGFVVIILLPLLLITAACVRDFSREYKKELKRMAEEIRQAEEDKTQTKR